MRTASHIPRTVREGDVTATQSSTGCVEPEVKALIKDPLKVRAWRSPLSSDIFHSTGQFLCCVGTVCISIMHDLITRCNCTRLAAPRTSAYYRSVDKGGLDKLLPSQTFLIAPTTTQHHSNSYRISQLHCLASSGYLCIVTAHYGIAAQYSVLY